MKNKKTIIMSASTLFIIMVGMLIIVPILHEKKCKTRVFEEMSQHADEIEKFVIGIIPETAENGKLNHNGYGSGVIFDKKENTYYAVTAAHVVEGENSTPKIFTKNTEFSGQTISPDANTNVVFEIPDDDYYASLLEGKVEYISDTTDLAIVSFETTENLPVLDFEDRELAIGSKVLCIGHPEGNRYQNTYGYVQSGLQEVTASAKMTSQNKTAKVVAHDAYLNYGNSGGVAISENLKIAGINIGGSFSLTGHFSKGFMIPWDIVKENIQTLEASKK